MNHPWRALPLLCSVLLLLPPPTATAQSGEWLEGDWSQRVELTVDPSLLPTGSSFDGMTLLLHLDGDSLQAVFSEARPDGADLVVTGEDGTSVLPHELIAYDATTMSGQLWFRTDALSESRNTFYLYYANPDTVIQSDPRMAWDENDLVVYHFEEDPTQGVLADSGRGANDAITTADFANWSADDLVDGKSGKGWFFDGIDNYAVVENLSAADSSFTISTWVAESFDTVRGSLAFQAVSGYWNTSFQRSPQVPYADVETANGYMTFEPLVEDEDMRHFAWVLDGVEDTITLYVDGVEQAVRVDYRADPSIPVYTGERIDGRVGIAGPAWYNQLDLSNAVVDEYRIFEGARDAEWIALEHRNQADPHSFFLYDVQTEQTQTSVGSSPGFANGFGRVQVWPNPFRGRADIGVETSGELVPVGVYDAAGRLVRTLRPSSLQDGLMRAQWNGRDEGGSLVAKGVYFIRAMDPRASEGTKVLFVR